MASPAPVRYYWLAVRSIQSLQLAKASLAADHWFEAPAGHRCVVEEKR